MKSLAISVALATLFSQFAYAQLTIEPFTDACIDGDLYQVVSGELIEYNFNASCEFIGTTICEEYTDVDGNTINLTEYNSLGFNEADGLLYGLTKNRELAVIGSNCVAEVRGRPVIDVPDGAPCEDVNNFPNTFSATFDEAGNALVLDNSADILYTLNVNTNIAESCVQLELNGGSVPTLADIAYASSMISGLTAADEGSIVGSIFGIEDGTIIAFYNSTGNYYEIDPETGVASFLTNTSSNSSNDGTSCSEVNIFCPDPLEGEAIPSCFDGNGDPANIGEYYIYLTTNYDPNNLTSTSATPDFTVIANGIEETTTYDGESQLILGPYTTESVIIEIKETDDGDIETKDFCVDVLEVIQVDEIPCANVPVELLSFDGKLMGEKVHLFWETASEINNDYFIVERSLDAKDFIPIGKVGGKGNSLSRVAYSFQEEISNQKNKDYYYRLKQVDFNGTFEYSQSIILQVENDKSDINIFPSPVTDMLQIVSDDAIERVRILDLNGKWIRELTAQEQVIFVSDLEAGIYFLEVWQDRKRQLLRFVVQ